MRLPFATHCFPPRSLSVQPRHRHHVQTVQPPVERGESLVRLLEPAHEALIVARHEVHVARRIMLSEMHAAAPASPHKWPKPASSPIGGRSLFNRFIAASTNSHAPISVSTLAVTRNEMPIARV
jgi:hypothetical protein